MEKFDGLIKRRNDNNDNKNLNIVNNDNGGKYALKDNFVLATEEAVAAKDIASELQDLKNFAFYYSAVQRLGVTEARRISREVLDDVRLGEKRRHPIRNPGALFNWKFQKILRNRGETNE